MFYQITGELILTEAQAAVIECGGIGYRLTVSGNTLSKISAKVNRDKVRLFTYLAVREDALELFGFYEYEELSAFKLLISVSGVGPKAAMSVLTQLSTEKFALAVTTGDTKALSKSPGIGAKTAARIVLELKDKIAKKIVSETGEAAVEPDSGNDALSEAQNALLVLGYSRAEAQRVLSGINTSGMELEDIIRAALSKLVKIK